jgi:hypothetical protein
VHVVGECGGDFGALVAAAVNLVCEVGRFHCAFCRRAGVAGFGTVWCGVCAVAGAGARQLPILFLIVTLLDFTVSVAVVLMRRR